MHGGREAAGDLDQLLIYLDEASEPRGSKLSGLIASASVPRIDKD